MTRYEWDPAKDRANQRKHGLGFEAMAGFDWDLAFGPRIDHVQGEEREVWTGPIDGALYTVVIVERGRATRIISLRRASNMEKREWRRSNYHA